MPQMSPMFWAIIPFSIFFIMSSLSFNFKIKSEGAYNKENTKGDSMKW